MVLGLSRAAAREVRRRGPQPGPVRLEHGQILHGLRGAVATDHPPERLPARLVFDTNLQDNKGGNITPMNSRTALAVVLVAASLAGCDRLQALSMSKVERINAAFPIPEELVTAQNRLFGDLEGDAAAKKRVAEAHAQMLQVRALTCSTGAEIGRFDTAGEIRAKLTNVGCFREQDQALQSWVGLQRFIRLVGKPPVAPLADLPPRTPILSPPEEPPSQLFLARAANVAVAQSARSKLSTVELPSGRVRLASYGQNVQVHAGTTLSPNGRVLATQAYNVLSALDTETGSVVWSSDKYREVVAWIPEVGATVLAQKGNSAPALLDHVRGTVEPYPVPLGRVSWAVNMPQMPTRVVIGDSSNLALVDHAREADGTLAVQVVRQFRFEGRGHTSGVPQVMAGGKRLVYVTMNDLGWVDLESGQQGVWQFSVVGGYGFSKLSERALVMDARGEGVRSDAHVFDIELGTLQAVEGSTNDGLLQPLVTRPGFARRGHGSMWLGTTVQPRGEPRALETLVAERLLAQQLAKVAAAENTPAALSSGEAGRGWSLPVPPGIEGRVAPAPVRPMLAELPPDARVAAIGVYEAAVTTQRSGAGRIGGIRVNLGPGAAPLVLVLASYEPVNWHIQDNGRKIAAILVSSYGGGSNVLVGGSPNIIKANLGYAYQLGSPEYQRLQREVAKYVAAPIGSFQGGYKGQEFFVR